MNYDLLAQKWIKYSYVYPFVEMLAGVAMISGFLTIISVPAELFIGGVGAIYRDL